VSRQNHIDIFKGEIARERGFAWYVRVVS